MSVRSTRAVTGIVALLLLAGLGAAFFDFPHAYNVSQDWLQEKTGYSLPRTPDRLPFQFGLDIQGGTHLVYEADTTRLSRGDVKEAVNGVRDVIERRVNAFGVAEPVVQTSRVGDSWRLLVELPGVRDVQEAIKRIGETPILEFRELNTDGPRALTDAEEKELTEFNIKAKAKADQARLKIFAGKTDFADIAKEFSEDDTTKEKGGALGFVGPSHPLHADIAKIGLGRVNRQLIDKPEAYYLVRVDNVRDGKKGEGETRVEKEYDVRQIVVQKKTESDIRGPVPEWKTTTLSGKHLGRATVQFDQTTGVVEIGLEFTSEGSTLFAEITKRNVGKPFAIFLDGKSIVDTDGDGVVTDQDLYAPVITKTETTEREGITGGRAVITGVENVNRAKEIARRLNAGALPIPITLIAQETIGATLGAESVTKSLLAGLIGFAFVALFMVLYYRLPGVIAVFALFLYAVFLMFVFKIVPVTLTLSGIAGFILTLGMAVDANVLIFERMKEELRRGQSLASAVEDGFKRAWPSIRDGNTTTLIAATILFWFSSGLIKGFALTLFLGVVMSMFTALTCTRYLLLLVIPRVQGTWFYGINPKSEIRNPNQ